MFIIILDGGEVKSGKTVIEKTSDCPLKRSGEREISHTPQPTKKKNPRINNEKNEGRPLRLIFFSIPFLVPTK